MLYRLEIENFMSVRDRQVLDLTIAPNVPDLDGRYAPLYPGSDLRAPKVIAIYGKNASGKTNILRALEVIALLARTPPQAGWPVAIEPFNDRECRGRPINFAVEFGGLMNLTPEAVAQRDMGEAVEWGVYRYEVAIEVEEFTPTRILSEALRQRPNGQGKWQRVVERDGDRQVKDSASFSLSGFKHLLNTLTPTTSVLASFAFFQHPTAQLFVDALKKVIFLNPSSIHRDQAEQHLFKFFASTPEILDALNRDLKRIDVGIEAMRMLTNGTDGPQPNFKHTGLALEMPWQLESHGTQKFIKVFPLVLHALESGGISVMDELDTAIHHAVLPEILGWFYAPDRNGSDGQLWMSCHAVSLLDHLNKEEVVICDKDEFGRTNFHSLMDVKVRRDDNLYRKYLGGTLGGLPQIG